MLFNDSCVATNLLGDSLSLAEETWRSLVSRNVGHVDETRDLHVLAGARDLVSQGDVARHHVKMQLPLVGACRKSY